MYRTIICSNYSGKNIVIRALAGAVACAILFFLFVQTAGPTKLPSGTRNAVSSAAILGLGLFVAFVLRFISLRHTRSFRYDGTQFLIWGGRIRPALDALQVLVHLGGALGLVLFAACGSIPGMIGFLGSLIVALGFEEYSRLMRYRKIVGISEIVSVKPLRASKEAVVATLKTGETVCLARVPEIEKVGSP
jgi:hypothetical protein